MARPVKNGISYWGFDTDFFENKKILLIKGEFGLKGVLAVITLLNDIYRGDGYYKCWDDDDSILLSEKLGDGCTHEWIEHLVGRCCDRGLFDAGMKRGYGILTSRGIQRRFLSVKKENSTATTVIEDYLLLDINDTAEVSESARRKLDVRRLNQDRSPENEVSQPLNTEKQPLNSTKQSKEKKSREKQSKAEKNKDDESGAFIGCGLAAVMDEFRKIRPATNEDRRLLLDMVGRKGTESVIAAIRETAAKGGRSAAYVSRILDDPVKSMSPQSADELERMLDAEWFSGEDAVL